MSPAKTPNLNMGAQQGFARFTHQGRPPSEAGIPEAPLEFPNTAAPAEGGVSSLFFFSCQLVVFFFRRFLLIECRREIIFEKHPALNKLAYFLIQQWLFNATEFNLSSASGGIFAAVEAKRLHQRLHQMEATFLLVGGFNPSQKYESNWESSPR